MLSHPYQQSGPPGAYPYSGPYSGDLHQMRLRKHTGLLLLFTQQTVIVTGDRAQCEHAYKNAQAHNLIIGWWSLASILFWNWFALIGNYNAIKKVRNTSPQQHQASYGQQAPIPHGPTPAGWYPDPSGQPCQRYWDGTQWTQWTNP